MVREREQVTRLLMGLECFEPSCIKFTGNNNKCIKQDMTQR